MGACDRVPAPYYCTARPKAGLAYATSTWETNACPCSGEFYKERHPGYGMIRFWRCYKKVVARLLPGVVVNQRNLEADAFDKQRKAATWERLLCEHGYKPHCAGATVRSHTVTTVTRRGKPAGTGGPRSVR